MYANTYSKKSGEIKTKKFSAASDFKDKESIILNAEWF